MDAESGYADLEKQSTTGKRKIYCIMTNIQRAQANSPGAQNHKTNKKKT